MNQFKKNKYYLLTYSLKSVMLFLILDIVLYTFKGVSLVFEVNRYDFLYILFPLLLCGLPSSLMHNCAHKNIKPHFLNELIGEICGSFMLYGFRGFALAHMFHHIHPDDPTMDPHPPRGQSFLRFVISPIKSTLLVVERAYYLNFGKNAETIRLIKLQLGVFNLGLILRTLFWFLLLGPKLFTFVFLPVYIANIFVFAHINYVAHQERADGSSEIINLNHNLYYKIANFLSFGGYFHKSHHLRPRAFNPSYVEIKEEVEYVTYAPEQGVRA